MYTCWTLTENARDELLEQFPPIYPDVIAHHVTCRFGFRNYPDLPPEVDIQAYAMIDDGEGCQVLVVSVDGCVDRPDGSFYHITWSLDRSRGRVPVHSNDVVKNNWHHILPIAQEVYPWYIDTIPDIREYSKE